MDFKKFNMPCLLSLAIFPYTIDFVLIHEDHINKMHLYIQIYV